MTNVMKKNGLIRMALTAAFLVSLSSGAAFAAQSDDHSSNTATIAALADSSPSSSLQVGGKGGREAVNQATTPTRPAAAASKCAHRMKPLTGLLPGGKAGAYLQWSDNIQGCSVTLGGAEIHYSYSKN